MTRATASSPATNDPRIKPHAYVRLQDQRVYEVLRYEVRGMQPGLLILEDICTPGVERAEMWNTIRCEAELVRAAPEAPQADGLPPASLECLLAEARALRAA